MKYSEFIHNKTQLKYECGFKPTFMPDCLFDFQKFIVGWSVKHGRNAIFADCGLGKTLMELVWAQNVVEHTNKNVLILTPLAVSHQFITEGDKFGIEVSRSRDGKPSGRITVTNYEKLHLFDKNDFVAVVCDESSILKNFDGVRKNEITKFMLKTKYRLLGTATSAPNDYLELGTSSEALGHMGSVDMVGYFFKNNNNNIATKRMYGQTAKFTFKGQGETPFWKWVNSWAISCRKPSDLGFDDGGFVLPDLIENSHVVDVPPNDGLLFDLEALDLETQRNEVKRTVVKRCEMAANIADGDRQFFIGCNRNEEAKLLKELIPNSVEVSGSDSDEAKEEKFIAFKSGQARCLITKPKIGAWGLNFQHANRIIYFPTHSYEQYYQFVRREWRFGQKNNVVVDRVLTPALKRVLQNVDRKAKKADQMFRNLVKEFGKGMKIEKNTYTKGMELPSWLKTK